MTTFMAAIILRVSSSRDVHTSHEAPRQLQDYVFNPGPPLTCNFGMSTLQTDASKLRQGDGIVFSMKSKDSDVNGVKITSFGFHVPAAKSQNVEFQVYALKQEGYYADPIRDRFNGGVSYDYRGTSQLDQWKIISVGTIQNSDLITSDTTQANDSDLYEIPFEMFTTIEIPPNGGVRSFYISTSLLYSDLMLDNVINDAQLLVGFNDPAAPELLVGEAAVGFKDNTFLYQPREFVGKFSYETACATEAPSISMSPSTSKPTMSPTLLPTTSHSPTDMAAPAQLAGAQCSMVFPLLMCDPNQVTVPQEVQDALSDQVAYTMSAGEYSEGFNSIDPIVLEAQVRCVTRRLTGDESQNDRLLATQSSAMEFSLVITGDYRSPDGKPPDMGKVVEDSINADATQFTKELKARSPNPLLVQATEPIVKAESLDADQLEKFNAGAFEVTIIAYPSPSPIPAQDKVKTALLIVILIVSGVMVVLAAFLLFKHAERRAIESRRKKMERISEHRVSAFEEETMKQEWEKENNMRMATNSWQEQEGKKQKQIDYYYGGPPPQHQEYPRPPRDHYQDSYEEHHQ